MGRSLLLGALLLLAPTGAGGPSDAYTSYLRSLTRLCPAKHLEWLSQGELDDLLEVNFHDGLPQSLQEKFDAAYEREKSVCANLTMGLACFNAARIRAIGDLNLLTRFSRLACDSGIVCRAPSECDR